jgi:hypothetical protein
MLHCLYSLRADALWRYRSAETAVDGGCGGPPHRHRSPVSNDGCSHPRRNCWRRAQGGERRPRDSCGPLCWSPPPSTALRATGPPVRLRGQTRSSTLHLQQPPTAIKRPSEPCRRTVHLRVLNSADLSPHRTPAAWVNRCPAPGAQRRPTSRGLAKVGRIIHFGYVSYFRPISGN